MIKKLILLAGLLLLLVQTGFAAETKPGPRLEGKVWKTGWHTAGLLHLKITNYGTHGFEDACEWPAGSGETYIFGAGIWVGCISSEGDTLVSVGYNPYDGSSEFAPGDLPNEEGYVDPLERIYWSDVADDFDHWPVVVDGDSVVVSSQDSWCQFNDCDSSRHAAGNTAPIGVKITQTGYSWNYEVYKDFIFLVYLVENISDQDLSMMYLGVACDADIGNFDNDTVDFDTERNLGYAFTARPPGDDLAGYIGYDFLESPLDSAGQQLGLTAFKIFTRESVPPDPGTDAQAYQVLAGYNYQTGEYNPFDVAGEPSDYRFIQCTGPFDLAAGDTARVVVAVLAGEDLEDLQANSDLAQNLYDQEFETHQVMILYPNGGEELSGTIDISWEATSATSNPLTLDIYCSRDRGKTWLGIASGVANDSCHQWNTGEFLDGANCLLRLVATDGVLIGEDKSDAVFTVNNPGNGVPDILLMSPNSGGLSGLVEIAWEAADPDGDSLSVGLFYSQDDTNWTEISAGLENDSSYIWNTYPVINGSYRLKLTASDAETTNQDMSDDYLTIYNDHELVDYITHVQGGCNTVTIIPFEHIAADLNGHDYQIRFNAIQQISTDLPLYTYDLYDLTSDSLLLKDQPLNVQLDGQLYSTWSPIVDGFSLKMDTYIDKSTFNFVSFEKVLNNSDCDALLSIVPSIRKWCFRGSDFELRWQGFSPDSLTLEVWDLDSEVAVPYAPAEGDNWAFASSSTNFSAFYRPGVDWWISLCGGIFVFDQGYTMAVPPQPGDVWLVTAAGDKVPCDGNVYGFGPNTPVDSDQIQADTPQKFELFQNYPNPFNVETEIRYEIPQEEHVTVEVFNLLGQRVRTLVEEDQEAGWYVVLWDGRDDVGQGVASGLYFCRLQAGDLGRIIKMVLLK
jgi:hypothetical protein